MTLPIERWRARARRACVWVCLPRTAAAPTQHELPPQTQTQTQTQMPETL
eukprot:COSAG01_NODE_31490_length_596_cov_2.275654_1_plen_49_part_01